MHRRLKCKVIFARALSILIFIFVFFMAKLFYNLTETGTIECFTLVPLIPVLKLLPICPWKLPCNFFPKKVAMLYGFTVCTAVLIRLSYVKFII